MLNILAYYIGQWTGKEPRWARWAWDGFGLGWALGGILFPDSEDMFLAASPLLHACSI